ncbi:MAG TPA: M56 family metallopeptidase, partial [Chitinophagaceae bacterium]|nr:M56 family metallopeptidase [Chitinophagaceae bacterium]
MLPYILKLSISLALVYIFYRAVLRPLTFYQWNRFYLLCYALLSFVIPFVNIAAWLPAENSHPLVNLIPVISSAGALDKEGDFSKVFTVSNGIMFLLTAGMLLMLLRMLLQYRSLRRIRQQAVLLSAKDGISLYETNAAVGPFSFGNGIYINRQMHSATELEQIIQHEFVHVQQKHTIDLLAAELVCVLCYFNPFAWAIRYSIRQNLEFIADGKVLANGVDKKAYQYLLLRVTGVPVYSLTGNFNLSHLKKRITMMNKMKSTRLQLAKFLFVLPLLAVLLLAFRTRMQQEAGQSIQSASTVRPQPWPMAETADTVPVLEVTSDTVWKGPATPHLVTSYNKKGYAISIADNNGECVVIVKDKKRVIVKALTLTEWNQHEKEYEARYGALPPAPPPPPAVAVMPEVPEPAALPAIAEPGTAAAMPSLQEADVNRSIVASPSTRDKSKVGIVTVTNHTTGAKEVYNFEVATEKAAFIKKYGSLPASPPTMAAPAGTPAAPAVPTVPANKNTVPAPPPPAAMYIVNGIV